MNNIRRLIHGLLCTTLLHAPLAALAEDNSAVAQAAYSAMAEATTPSPDTGLAAGWTFPQEAPLALTTDLSSQRNDALRSIPNNAAISTIDLTSSSDDIWARIRKGFGMPDLVSPLVDDRTNYYAMRPQALRTMLERSRKYLYHIVGELEKRGMPTELALLPLVESAFNPQALSSAKAAGLWQFIPSTGKDYQLTQNWWVDKRRDVVASTNAALQYLQAIYEMQGDWHLALASYNWGEGAVAKAMTRNVASGKPVDFNSLNMPAETRQYVPRLQALKQIIAHPENYGVTLPPIPNRPYFVSVERTKGMDVAVAAKLAEMSQADFLALNPAFNRPVIPGNHDADLVLPVENARRFEQNIAHYDAPLLNWKTYALPQTARVDQIAARLKVDAATLQAANSLAPRARLAAGYTLLIPQSADTTLLEIARNDPESVPARHRGRSARASAKASSQAAAVVRKSKPEKLAHNSRGHRS